jgi:general secretion pathway protein G
MHMNAWAKRTKQGFTIIELLIVIVVIGILASITIVAYNGVQGRAQDARRMSDIVKIQQGLELYKIQNGSYPAATSANTDSSGWELSYVTGSFIPLLKSSGTMSAELVDPINNSTYSYRYYRYAAGLYACDVTKGAFYVLQIRALQSQAGTGDGPGFSCTGTGGRNWSNEAAWTVGGYTN